MPERHPLRVQFLFWIAAICAVIAVGLYYFPREFNDKGFWKPLYFTLRLFIFEHDHDRFPTAWPLIAIYFVAPLLTLSGISTAISYMLHASPNLKTRLMKDHAVVCGMGRTGRLFARALRRADLPAVGIDISQEEETAEWCKRFGVPLIRGDFHSRAVLERAGAPRARTVIFSSGGDLLNLEGALAAHEWLAAERQTPMVIWAQITSEALADTTRFFLESSRRVSIRLFDTYRIAARKMIAAHFTRQRRAGIREVDILGYGKFGRDLMEIMLREVGNGDPIRVRVIDLNDRRAEVTALAAELGFSDRVVFQQADIQDLAMIYRPERAYFICTDDDLKNLTAAMSLARRMAADNIYVRMAHWPLSAVSNQIGEVRGIEFVNINELVLDGITDLPGIFTPPGALETADRDPAAGRGGPPA